MFKSVYDITVSDLPPIAHFTCLCKYTLGKSFANLADNAHFSPLMLTAKCSETNKDLHQIFAKMFLAICFISGNSPNFKPFKIFSCMVKE